LLFSSSFSFGSRRLRLWALVSFLFSLAIGDFPDWLPGLGRTAERSGSVDQPIHLDTHLHSNRIRS
jgi:hypothetical protein